MRKKIPEARKDNQLKELEGTVPAAYTRSEKFPAPTSHTRKTHNSWVTGRSCFGSWGIISSILSIAPDLPNKS